MHYATENAIERILSGQKTQTRRLLKIGDTIADGVWRGMNRKVKKRVGSIYTVQPGRGRPAAQVATLNIDGRQHLVLVTDTVNYYQTQPLRHRIIALVEEDCRQISLADAHAEGFADEIEFWKIWVGMHDKAVYFRAEKPGRFVDSTRRTVPEIRRMLLTRPASYYRCAAITFEVVV